MTKLNETSTTTVSTLTQTARSAPTAAEIIVKTAVVHTVTYFIVGVAVLFLFNYPKLFRETVLSVWMRPIGDPMVMAGPLFQPIRGIIFGAVFYLLREPFFARPRGWLTMWVVLVAVGIVGTFGAPPGSIEGMIYTVLPFSIHLKLLPEVLVQSFLLSFLVFRWVNRSNRTNSSGRSRI